MAGSAKIRNGTRVSSDGTIHHNDTLMSWPDADNRAGFRLDRRKAWCFIPNEQGLPDLCEAISWSSACSGCTEVPEMTSGPDRGSGCSECGYTGRIRNAQWVPYARGEYA